MEQRVIFDKYERCIINREKVREVVQLVLLMTKMMAMTTSMTMLFSGMVP